jgi:hypothetical protein
MMEEGDDRIDLGQHPGARGDVRINTLLAKIALCMAEMEQGQRPVGSLDAIASPLAARRIRHLVHHADSRPGRIRRRVRRTVPLHVRSTSSFQPSAGVTEGVVIIAAESRTRAYCVRLEREEGRWRLVELARPDGGLRPAITAASRTGGLPIDERGVRRSSGGDGIAFAAPTPPGTGRGGADEDDAAPGPEAAGPTHDGPVEDGPDAQGPSGGDS